MYPTKLVVGAKPCASLISLAQYTAVYYGFLFNDKSEKHPSILKIASSFQTAIFNAATDTVYSTYFHTECARDETKLSQMTKQAEGNKLNYEVASPNRPKGRGSLK